MTQQILSTKNEIKFAVEAMTQCGANCVGCFLTPELRQSQDFWKEQDFEQAKQFIKASISNLSQQQNIDEIAINMGQGDYFQLNESQVRQVIDFIYECADGKASAFITASGITNKTKLQNSVDYFYEYSLEKKQALLIDFVLDASKLSSEKMFAIYAENLTYIRQKFGHVDINLNISADTVLNVSPETINHFMISNELKFLVINVVPANHNKTPLQQSWNTIMNWMKRLYEIWDKSLYELNYANTIRTLLEAYPSTYPLTQAVNTSIKETLLKEYVIDNSGIIFFQQAGFGDLPLSSRNGFKPVGSIKTPFNYESLTRAATQLCSSIIRQQMSEPCNSCDYLNVCSANGMYAVKHTLHQTDSVYQQISECPINIISLYEIIRKSENNHTLKKNGKFSGIYAQKGLENEQLRLESMDYSEQKIHIPK